jgi:hypothetical protein
MTRLLTVLLLTAAVAGCGGAKKPPQPTLPVALAEQLAGRSDKVAAALDAGDPCRALKEARRLRDEMVAAVNAGRVPSPFQEQLGSSVQDLVQRIQCVPPQAKEDEDRRGGEHKGKGKGKKGHD